MKINIAKKMSEKYVIAKACVKARKQLELYMTDVKTSVIDGDSQNHRVSRRIKRNIERELVETSIWLDKEQYFPSIKEDYEDKLKALQDRLAAFHL
ncbi:hypothetical protein LINGRAPRIM_LOCUS2151 [Linum grandiflorum]